MKSYAKGHHILYSFSYISSAHQKKLSNPTPKIFVIALWLVFKICVYLSGADQRNSTYNMYFRILILVTWGQINFKTWLW